MSSPCGCCWTQWQKFYKLQGRANIADADIRPLQMHVFRNRAVKHLHVASQSHASSQDIRTHVARVNSIHSDQPRSGFPQTEEHVQQKALSAATGATDCDFAAGLNRQRYMVQNLTSVRQRITHIFDDDSFF